jgi:hypothetical protein
MSDRTGSNSGDSMQQLTSSMRQMQTLAFFSCELHKKSVVPVVQKVPVVPSLTAVQSSKVQRPMTTPRSRFSASRRAASACAGWMFSSPLMTDKNSSICYLNRLRNSAGFPSIVSDEQSCSLCGGAPSGEIARAHVPEKSIAIFREGWRVICGRSASILIRWTNGKVWGHS